MLHIVFRFRIKYYTRRGCVCVCVCVCVCEDQMLHRAVRM